MDKPTIESLGALLSLVIHDLRNPTATLSANISFINDVFDSIHNGIFADDDTKDIKEALLDTNIALGELMNGLDAFSWVTRWVTGREIVELEEGDVVAELNAIAQHEKRVRIEIDAREGALMVRGGNVVPKLLETLIANSIQHAPYGIIRVVAQKKGEDYVLVQIRDQGLAVAEDLRDKVFTLEGQVLIKGRRDGRYSRVVGLFAAATMAEAIAARLEADGQDGDAVFRIYLKRV
ncbi:MAG: HAMP domain-containing histidine kinase [Deltaproteobacteria bacterium]|nr:HAMP domain-containing histidine kinase [Deltaproteobacteria bacterium]